MKGLAKEAKRLLNLASELLSSGNYQEAEKIFRNALLISPDYPEVHFKFGEFLYRLKRYEEAEKEFREYLKYKPEDLTVYSYLGEILLNLKKFDEAICVYRQAVDVFPDLVSMRCRFGEVLFKAGKYKEAEKEYREAIRRNPRYLEAHIGLAKLLHHLKRCREALFEYRKILMINPHCAQAHIEFGIFLYELGYFEKAENEFKRAIEIKPHDERAHYWLGHTFTFTKRVSFHERSELAAEVWKKAIELNPTFVDPYISIACHYDFMRESERAIEFLEEALRIEPNNAEAYYQLGDIYLRKGMYYEAEKNFRMVLMIDPNFDNAAEKLKATISLKELQEEVLKSPESAEARLKLTRYLSNFATHLGIRGLMAKELRKIIDLDPNNAEAYYLLSEIIIFLDPSDDTKREKELEYLEKATILNPNYIEARVALGSLYYSKGRYECAEKELRKVIEIEPNHVRANLLLATLFTEFNFIQDAEEIYKKLVKLGVADKGLYSSYVEVLLKLGKFNEILEVFKKGFEVFEKKESDKIGLLLISRDFAKLLLSLKKYDELEKLYKKLMKACPYSKSKLFNFHYEGLANVYILRKAYKKAVNIFERLLDVDPLICSVYLKLGLLYLKLGEKEKAVEYILKAKEFANDDGLDAMVNLCTDILRKVKRGVGLKKYLSEEFITKGLSISYLETMRHIRRSRKYLKVGKTENAEMELLDAIELRPNDYKVLYEWSSFLDIQKRYDEEREVLQKLVKLFPYKPDSYYKLAQLYLKLNDKEKALDWFVKAENLYKLVGNRCAAARCVKLRKLISNF